MATEDLAREVSRRLSPGIPADLGAGWIEGLSKRNRAALLARQALWEELASYVQSLDDEQFQRAIVFLRRAFGGFSPAQKQRYGSPRMTAELNARGFSCSVNMVAKLMNAHEIQARQPRRFVRTTDSKHQLPVAANLLARCFEASRPNQFWGADITYLPTGEGWLYLAVVEDLFSRMVVGWSMAETMESQLVVDALEMAIARRRPGVGLLALELS